MLSSPFRSTTTQQHSSVIFLAPDKNFTTHLQFVSQPNHVLRAALQAHLHSFMQTSLFTNAHQLFTRGRLISFFCQQDCLRTTAASSTPPLKVCSRNRANHLYRYGVLRGCKFVLTSYFSVDCSFLNIRSLRPFSNINEYNSLAIYPDLFSGCQK